MDAATRRLVKQRAGMRCEYCGVPAKYAVLSLHVEHIVSIKHGGQDSADNLALACIDCNLHKGTNIAGIDPLSSELTVLFHPRQHVWVDHFERVGGYINGLTPIGRTTVFVLCMNLDELVEFREMSRFWER